MNISNYMSDKLSKRSQSTELQNLLIVDPNPCGSSVVNVEDLSISVELQVYRRSDDIIIWDTSNGQTEQQTNGTDGQTTRISFIDGAGDKKELTTKYTELNTDFNKSNPDLQTLGIESIDISFNTSYTPIVKIKFKDIRGKLFEMGSDSPYSFLFRMPYPIFYLTVKGYYGKPVEYALHLTKFNGALDSDTGSFIITCDFIGYTYAFLSDLLMGYLRAFPFTERGQGIIGKDEFKNFVNFEQLQKVITELNTYITKFKENDEKLKALTIYGDLGSKLDAISGQLKAQLTTLENRRTINSTNEIVYTLNSQDLSRSFIKDYQDSVIKLVNEYNQFTKVTNAKSFELNTSKFVLDSDGIFYKDFEMNDFIIRDNISSVFRRFKTLDEFQDNSDIIVNKYKNFILTGTEKIDNIIERKYNEFIQILNQPPFISSNSVSVTLSKYNMLDARFAIQQINDIREQINNELIDNKNLVSEEFISKLNDFFDEQGIDFDGSIGSFFRILCSHVDLLIRVLRDLGLSIKTDIDSGIRTIQGSNKETFTEYKDDNNNSTITIKAFPEYVEKEDGALVEKWLGSNPKFKEFKEVTFIEDLLNSIIKSKIKDQEFLLNVNKNEKGWYPVNPLETKAFNGSNTNPWLIPQNKVEIFPAKLLYQRMILFLTYTNSNLSSEEIRKMAKLEARQMYDTLLNSNVKKGIVSDNTDILGVNGKIASWSRQIREKFGMKFLLNDEILSYRHTSSVVTNDDFDKPTATYIPINQSLSTLEESFNQLNSLEERSVANTFVSTVVSNVLENDTVPNSKEYETFIKIINRSNYSDNFLYDYDSDLNIDSLTSNFKEKKVNISNVNKIFGGKYRTHEFLEYKHEVGGNIPLFYEFYEGGNDVVNSFRKDSTQNEYDTFISDGNGNFIYNPNSRLILTQNDKQRLGSIYDKKTFKSQLIENIEKGNPINRTFKFQPMFRSSKTDFSLFGSEFYYRQSNIGRAFLFLHTLPFAGMGGEISTGLFGNGVNKGLLQGKEINYFNQRGGFVSVPYSWVLFMGAILYRNSVEDFLIFNDDNNQTFIPKLSGSIQIEPDSYLIGSYKRTTTTTLGLNLEFLLQSQEVSYDIKINDIISRLPDSVKNEFKLTFENWVDDINNNGWLNLKNNLEIFSDNAGASERNAAWDNFSSVVNSEVLRTNVAQNYVVVSKDTEENHFVLDLRDGGEGANQIIDLLFEERIIINSTYRIWNASEDRFINFDVPEATVNTYLGTFFEEFKTLNTKEVIDPVEEVKQSLFNTNDDDDIKLSLYKNVKSIYDKWVVGIPQIRSGVVTTDLYNKFNFIDRAYIDISDKFKIAPTTFVNYWKDNTNISFYNFIARILRDNNFDFIPLPTYINYNDKEEIRDVFEPFRFNEAPPASGPSFICMYFGEQSNKLNIEKGAKFKKNDSWSLDVKCNGDNISVNNSSQLPDDFVSGSTKVPYFLVKYADQNQSLFKSFSLDQSEFTETQESLEIIESLSNQNRNNSIGQNLFDIYNNRAYSCEVEMLGCAQIQPFMYFQLDNIPMFDGAYNIINTRHSIKANHMTTTFKGVRVRAVKTKMIDDKTLYAHLITNLNEVSKEGADLDSLTTGSNKNKPNTKSTDIEAKVYKNNNTIFNTNLIEIEKPLLTSSKINLFIDSVTDDGTDIPLNGQNYIDLALKYNVPLELMLLQAAAESNFGTKGAATSTFNIFNILNITEGDTLTPEEAKRLGYRKDYGSWEVGVKAYTNTIKSYIPDDNNWLNLLNYDKFRRKDYNARYAATKDYEGSLRVLKIKLENIVNS